MQERDVNEFFTNYTFEEDLAESGFLEKNPENLRLIQSFYDNMPNCVWSLYSSGHIVCGYHFIDVEGYYITLQEGKHGETYFDADLKELFES